MRSWIARRTAFDQYLAKRLTEEVYLVDPVIATQPHCIGLEEADLRDQYLDEPSKGPTHWLGGAGAELLPGA
jgi:hypothetical protein